jgi:hypothetical protein
VFRAELQGRFCKHVLGFLRTGLQLQHPSEPAELRRGA